MAYKQGYTNAKNALADFITTVCFDDFAAEKFETWQLIYPQIDDRNEAWDWIINNRRATISSTFLPKNEWQNNEVFKINQDYLDNFIDSSTFEIPLLKTIYDQSAVKLSIKGHKGIFCNNLDLEHLNIMEFYADVKNKSIVLLKETLQLQANEELTFLITYQTYSNDPVTWYVDFVFPENIEENRPNYNYFEWTFGNAIDETTYHVICKKTTPPVMRCFWHTVNKLKAQAADWLPIEYFISWDDTAISFVMCEDPITDINAVVHAFNYIGVLDSIKNADYDDIKNNFGSSGSYDIMVQPAEGVILNSSEGRTRANITFLEKHYNSYFDQVEEHILLKLNNVPYANYTIGTDMINNENLLQPITQQYIIGDPARNIALSRVKTTSPIGTTMSLYDIYQKAILADFTLSDGIAITKVSDPTSAELKLTKPTRMSIANGTSITIPKDGSKITIIKDTIVTNLTTLLPETLSAGTEIYINENISISYNNGLIPFPINTEFKLYDGTKYRTISIMETISSMIILYGGITLTIKDDTTVYVPDPSIVIREELLSAGTVVKLKTTYAETKFDVLQEYVVEFHYRDPYLGDMHYDFPSKWFNESVSKTFTDFSGSTPLPIGTIAPILPERMVLNSSFENEYEHPPTITGGAVNKNNVRNRLSYSMMDKNNYHKNKITVPEIITNIQTGESWVLNSAQVKDPQIEKIKNSITNICMYPRQVYVGNFCYNKRTMNKCTVTLGDNDISRMRLVLTTTSGKVLVNFDGIQIYKNLTITRNTDNGITLEVDFNNLNNENVHINMYKLNNYFSNRTTGNWWQTGYWYGYPIKIETIFNYSGHSELVSRITNTTTFSFAGNAVPGAGNDFYTSIPTLTTTTPDEGFDASNSFRLMTIDLNSIHKTFIPNVIGMGNMQNIWM